MNLSSEELNIFHIDMDAFYASVEEIDNPNLRGKPVIVGGNSRSGIVTTANYEARKFGIHSAMPIFMAKKKCPHGYYLPTRKDRYKEASEEVFKLLYDITKAVEPVSIDEAYIDIADIGGNYINIANYMKKKVKENTGLTMSIGISYNKFLAKLASDWNKPNGLTVIEENQIPDLLYPLDIEKIHGIGPKTAKKLNNIGIYRVRDLYPLSKDFLEELFGKQGKEIYDKIRGIDERPVNTERERKSLGTERTFKKSTSDKEVLVGYLEKFAKEISQGLIYRKIYGRTISIKVKYEDFTVITRSKTLINDTNNFKLILNIGLELLEEISLKKEVRLIGLTVSNLTEKGVKQLSIF